MYIVQYITERASMLEQSIYHILELNELPYERT